LNKQFTLLESKSCLCDRLAAFIDHMVRYQPIYTVAAVRKPEESRTILI